MSYVSAKDFLDLSKMLPEQRFEYMLSNMLKVKYLWGLFGKDGWVMLKADEDTCMPVWPHKEFAEAWVKEDYPDCEAKQIDFLDWINTWLPGMQKNNTLVLVFPLGDDEEGIILDAAEMLECIDDDLNAQDE